MTDNPIERAIAGALRSAINDHGPITTGHIGSAAKRILGNLQNTGGSAATPSVRGVLEVLARLNALPHSTPLRYAVEFTLTDDGSPYIGTESLGPVNGHEASAPREESSSMTEQRQPLTDVDLDQYERWAREDLIGDKRGNLAQQAAARRTIELISEVRRLRAGTPLSPPAVEDPLSDDELEQLVDERTDDTHRWISFRAVREIKALRRQLEELQRQRPE